MKLETFDRYAPQRQAAKQAGYSDDEVNAFISTMQPPQQQEAIPQDKGNWFTNSLSTAGGILGGIGGSFLGPGIGTAAGGAVGAGAGKWLENLLEGNKDLGEGVLGEAAFGTLGGIGKGFRAIKGAAGALRAGEGIKQAGSILKSGLPTIAKDTSTSVMGKFGGKIGRGLEDRATTNMLKLTPSQTKNMLDSGVDPTELAKVAARYGKTAEDIIGKTGKGGPIQQTIKSLESGIQTTASRGGTNVKIDASDVISSLKSEAKSIKKELGGGARLKQLNKVIADAEAKYGKGVTVGQALKTLRSANAQFGKAILDDSGDAVIKAAQKLEANTLRKLLKERYPSIAGSLDEQSKLIQTREALLRARAVERTGGFKTGAFDLTRPGTVIDPLLNSATVTNKILTKGGQASPSLVSDAKSILSSTPGKIASTQLVARGLTGNLPSNNEILLAENAAVNQMTGSPSFSGGQGDSATASGVFGGATPQTSVYTREAAAQDIQRDLQATGGANMEKYMTLYQFLNPEPSSASQKPLSAEASKVIANAQGGLESLGQLEQMIQSGGVPLGTVVPGRDWVGGLGASILGTSGYDTAAKNVADVITRLRTGAAITESEEAFYKAQLPQAFDPPEVRAQKMDMFRNLFSRVAGNTGSAPSDTAQTLSY